MVASPAWHGSTKARCSTCTCRSRSAGGASAQRSPAPRTGPSCSTRPARASCSTARWASSRSATAGRGGSELDPHEHVRRGRLVAGGEPHALIQRPGAAVRLAHVELHAPAPARTRTLESQRHELLAQPLPAILVPDEEVLEPAVVGRHPEPVSVAQLAYAARLRRSLGGGEEVLGVVVLDQPPDAVM